MALRRARHGERPARGEEAAIVIQPMHLGRIGELPGGLVEDDRVILPRVPVAHHHFQELIGAVVAQVVRRVRRVAHVQRLAVVQRGDDVPGGPPAGHQVERGEHAGDVERFVIGGGIGRGQTEPFRRHAHHGQDGHRVQLDAANAVGDGVRVIAAVTVRHRQTVVEEGDVEFAGFQGARDAAVVLGRGEVGRCLRVAPGADEVGAVLRLQERDQGHLTHGVLRCPRWGARDASGVGGVFKSGGRVPAGGRTSRAAVGRGRTVSRGWRATRGPRCWRGSCCAAPRPWSG